MTDPNWLLSTLAQSSAALVAIGAGLLATRIVGSSGERSNAEYEAKVLLGKVEVAELDYNSAREARRDRTKSDLWQNLLNDFPSKARRSRIEDLVVKYSTTGSNPDETKEWLMGFLAEVEELESLLDRAESVERVNETKVSGGNRPQIFKALQEERSSGASWNLAAIPPPPLSAVVRAARDAEFRELIAREQSAKTELGLVLRAWNVADERLNGLAKPESFRPLFKVLGYIALVGLVIPLVTMASNPKSVHPLLRTTMVAAFVVGIGALFSYFWKLARPSHSSNEKH